MRPVRLPPCPSGCGVFPHLRLCLKSSLHPDVSNLCETEHAAIGRSIRAGLCEVIERRAGSLNDVASDEWRALGRALLGALDAAFPFEDRPAVEIILRELRENAVEIHLAVAGPTKTSGAIDPGVITTV